jgi:hypothetical protein
VERADWTYELPPAAADPEWLENYTVYGSDGEGLGKVAAVVEHARRRYLIFDRSAVPFKHERVAVPFDRVANVDHDNYGVDLSVASDELERHALELDPDKGVEGGEAEARRVSEPAVEEIEGPDDPAPQRRVEPTRSSIRTFAPFIYAVAALIALGIAAVLTEVQNPAVVALVAVPVALVVLTVFLSWRAGTAPHQRREISGS